MQAFSLPLTIDLLYRTPALLRNFLWDIEPAWAHSKPAKDKWSPFDVIGHLIHGEKTDWIPRLHIMLNEGTSRSFEPFDRFAQFEVSKGKTLKELLSQFTELRTNNLSTLKSLKLQEKDFNKTGLHPELGQVNVRQLLSAWTVHDLNHIQQIVKAMAHYYINDTGAWRAYLGILN